ncbi:MAG: type II toxin-antitoxin system PemK/MazF family toxin [Ilumatobacter sp.]|uniref:type II toxin-antitoxin system PemK/MazF family toxin n=1 Tax=Ilumatobacter sp. TaxID=1967498 RepID=UPI003298EB35
MRLRIGRTVGHEQSGTRPGVVVQSNALLRWSTVLVAPLSTGAQPSSFRPEVEVDGIATRVLTDQLRAADISRIGDVVGHLSVSEMWSLERAMGRVLDL